MSVARRYRLLCPIARALDHVGDRWALLILRDLHAGPARFSELQTGLTGIAPNLLTDRLLALVADGLVERREGPHNVTVYALTRLGLRTRDLLFELARFGGSLAPEPGVRVPGNMRSAAVTLAGAIERVAGPGARMTVQIDIDGEPFRLTVADGSARMLAGRAEAPEVTLAVPYEAFVAAATGERAVETFMSTDVTIRAASEGKEASVLALVSEAISYLAASARAD